MAHRELELKAVVPDSGATRERLRAAGAVARFVGRMIDVRYDRAGELAARDEVLRVRIFRQPNAPARVVLGWKGPTRRSADGYKLRDEIELSVESPAEPERLLIVLGYAPVHTIEREVEIYQLENAIVRLETYPRMDVLLEVEGEPTAIERAVKATGIPRAAFTAESLAAFVRRFEERTGQPAVLATRQPAARAAVR